MNYQQRAKELKNNNFTRVERDDRLLDIFPKETSEKGVELWEYWTSKQVEIIRLWNGQQTRHTFSREQIEQALITNKKLTL